ncbi:uncharacterized protein LOC143989858 [Lithobates pipiens]
MVILLLARQKVSMEYRQEVMSGTHRKFRVRGESGGSREKTLLEEAAEELSVYKETCIDQMMAPMRMEEDWSNMTEKILNLTLEIIYLLTGERFPLVKSGDHMTITVPPCDSLKPERHNMEKILEVTKKMMELLTGEVRRILGHYPVTDKGCVWMVTVSLCVSGSYKVSGCHCLFLHGGVGVFRRTQGSLQGRHDGQSAAPHITG